MSNIIIKKVEQKDLSKLVALHIDAFANFFLTSLGREFLMTYYHATLKEEQGVLLGAFKENRIVAFASGTLNGKEYHKTLFIKNIWAFSRSLLQAIIKNPMSLKRLYKNLNKGESPLDDKKYAELLSIAVSPQHQGSGLSSKVLLAFEDLIRSKGKQRLSLTTDKLYNERAIAFYKKNGYQNLYCFKAYPEREMLRMIKNL